MTHFGYTKNLIFIETSLVTLRMSVCLGEKLFLKAPNIYSLLFHFLQLFMGWDQIRVKLWYFLLNYFVSLLLIYFATVVNQ